MPGDLVGRVPQEIRVVEARQTALTCARAERPRAAHLVARGRLRLGDQLLLVERALEAAAQRCACVRS